MKKTTLTLVLMASMNNANAYFIFISNDSTFSMYDNTGTYVGGDPSISGSMDFDMYTGYGSANINLSEPFSGQYWTAHDIQFQLTGPSSASSTMLLDWGSTTNIFVTIDFDTFFKSNGGIDFFAIDGDGDGILGNAIENEILYGFSPAFNIIGQVPIPASAWLFGSGIIGLAGLARRKKA